MTPETEARIRKLSADVVVLERELEDLRLRMRNKYTLPLEEAQALEADYNAVYRKHYEVDAERLELMMSHREVGQSVVLPMTIRFSPTRSRS